MKHKLFLRRCFALLLLLAVSTLSWAYEYYDFAVGGIYYQRNMDGKTVKVTYKSDIYYGSYSGSVRIPSSVSYGGKTYSVTGIGNYAFYRCYDLTSITIPNSVTSIGEYAFGGCTSLPVIDNIRYADVCIVGVVNKAQSTYSIKEGTRFISAYAFADCSNLTSISIPEGVTSIGDYAFSNCSNLTTVTMGSGVKSLESNVFYRCFKLASINISESITSIGQNAFSGCSSLKSIIIPGSVSSIKDGAFKDCSSLTSVTINSDAIVSSNKSSIYNIGSVFGSQVEEYVIGNGVTGIGDYAFSGCSGCTSIKIPESVQSIGKNAFYGCSGLTSVTIPNSVTSIGDMAFSSCPNLTSAVIGNSVTNIGYSTFAGCSSLASVVIGNSVTSIDHNIFTGCVSLTSVTIYSDAVASKSYDSYSNNTTIRVFGSKIREFIFGGGVKSIGSYAFRDYPVLATVKIGDSVTSVGSGAFYNCTSLPIQDGIRYADTYLVEVVDKSQSAYTIKEGTRFIGSNTFSGCYNLLSITIPESVTSIDPTAFNNCSGLPVEDGIRYADTYLVEVVDKSQSAYTIKEGTRFIGSNAFSGCSGLTSFTIPNSVTSIGNSAFSYCPNLTSISIPNSVKSIGSSVFSHCSGLASISVDANNTEYDSRNNCNAIIQKSSNTLIAGCKNTTIPNGVTSIGFEALAYCSDLTSITIPESVTTIGGRAFASCTGLTSFTIGSGVKLIGYYAFHGCTGLTSLTISESVTEIEHDAFNACTGLTSVYIPKGVKEIHNAVFAHCSSLASIKVDPDNTAYDSRNDCNAIISGSTLKAGCKNTIIPDGISKIENYAFSGCFGLTSIIIPESVTKIDVGAFSSCSNLRTMTCMATKVPGTGSDPFSNTPVGSAILYVPAESLEAYKTATYWKDFGAIRAIGDVPGTEPLDYYDMEGVEKSLVDRDVWSSILNSTPNAIALVGSEQAEWASQHQNILVTGADGSYSCADFLLTDLSQGYSTNASEAAKTGFFTPVSFKATKGTYKRQAYAGYNTLCLPFSFKASDLSSSAKVFTFDSYDAEESKVIFKAVGGTVAAGIPCIVKEKADVVWTVNLSGKTIEAAQPSEDSHMRGTYVTTVTWQGKGYSPRSSDGRFAPLTQYLHPFRACFSVSDLNNVGARGSISAVFMDEDGVTAIDTLSVADNATDAPKSIYTLSGQRVKEIKRSGLYIVNGKKQYIEVK